MKRDRKYIVATDLFIGIWVLLGIAACSKGFDGETDPAKGKGTAELRIGMPFPHFATKSASPDEDLLSDLNVFIFSSKGELEDSRYLQASALTRTDEGYCCTVDILKNNRYSIYVCANIGYRIRCSSQEEVEAFRYHLAYPDDFKLGIPMSGCLRNVAINGDKVQELTMPLERTMARVRLRVDRSQLNKDVSLLIRSVKVCGCPKSVLLFAPSKAENSDAIFSSGFSKTDLEVCDLYLLENRQGKEKSGLCSYIEMKAQYVSATLYNDPGKYITYRFYLGDGGQDYEVIRNCSYTVTVTPKGEGLGNGDDWRVDKGDLKKFVQSISLNLNTLSFNYKGQTATLTATVLPQDAGNDLLEWRSDNPEVATVNSNGTVTATGNGSCTISCWSTDGSEVKADCRISVAIEPAWVKFHNTGYLEARVGEQVHIWAEYFPPNMSCKLDKDYLDFDVSRGIYSYKLSEDGSDVVLDILKKGSGMLRYDVGEPLDTSALIFLVVEP